MTPAPFPVPAGRGLNPAVRTMFSLYWLVMLLGLVAYVVVGVRVD